MNEYQKLEKMTNYLLSGKAKINIVKKMSSDIANIIMITENAEPLRKLINSDVKEAHMVAVSAADFIGPSVTVLIDDLRKLSGTLDQQSELKLQDILKHWRQEVKMKKNHFR